MSTDETLSRALLLIVAIVVLVPFAMFFLMFFTASGHMMDGSMWGTGGTGLWLVPMLVVLAFVAVLGYALTRQPGEETDPALKELRVAYARGELSDEEFERRREKLERDR